MLPITNSSTLRKEWFKIIHGAAFLIIIKLIILLIRKWKRSMAKKMIKNSIKIMKDLGESFRDISYHENAINFNFFLTISFGK